MNPSPIELYDWLLHEFSVERRARLVEEVGPHLASLVRTGDLVLDLCCGAGPFAFFLEGRGAKVVAVDFAPPMIKLAREVAARRGSSVEFVEANVLNCPWKDRSFDLAVLLGNTVTDFAAQDLARLGVRVGRALRPGGRFAVHYLDGVKAYPLEGRREEYVQQETPVRVTGRFVEYRCETGEWVEEYRNGSTGGTCKYVTHVHAVPHVRLALGASLAFGRSVVLGDGRFLDLFVRDEVAPRG